MVIFPGSIVFANTREPLPLINLQDTVIFDLSQAACSAGLFEFPVYINSDEEVYALDFSMKFDPADLSYLNAINLQSYLITSAWYNNTDSTLRFSSYSIQPMDNNTPLVKLVFTLPSAQINLASFDSVYTLLNGDDCSKRFIDPILPVSINVAGGTVITPGDSLLLSVNFISGVSYQWSTGETTASVYVNGPGTYSVTVATLMGCISFASIVITTPSPLPVELIAFYTNILENGIQLKWTTSSELNNNFFEIQKMDAQREWKIIHRVQGAGTSNNIHHYSYIDLNPKNGDNYFRLRQMDYDGLESYSNVIRANYVINMVKPELKVFPNPVLKGKAFSVSLNSFDFENANLMIMDSQGRIVFKQSVNSDNSIKNENTLVVDINIDIAPGLYFATLYITDKYNGCKFAVR